VAREEHDDDSGEPTFRDPLPQDDRLWRHPSELEEQIPPKRLASARVGKLLSSLFSRQRP
jgi:hypothetical protein